MISTTYHTLGYNEHHYRLKLDYDRDTKQLTVSVDGQHSVSQNGRGEDWTRLSKAIHEQLFAFAPSIKGEYTAPIKRAEENGNLVFYGVGDDFVLKLKSVVIGGYTVESGDLQNLYHRRLTTSEIRRMGTFHKTGPYEREPEDDSDKLRDHATKAVFTDFHTHSSGQITPEGLIKVARAHDAYYPLSLLELAGIDTSFRHFPNTIRKMVPRIPFPPRDVPNMPSEVEAVPLNALSDEELQILAKRMSMPVDRQSTYSEMENDAYRFRYPLTKREELLSDTFKEVANEYVAQGVKHADIAMVGLEKPSLLRIVHKALHELEQDPKFSDFSMHFMVGIPRNYTLPKMKEMFEKTKILSQSPYITGVDLIGYEINKTREFAALLDEFCAWANENRPGFTVRVHAGENDKNLDNVKDFLELAQKYPNLHFRVGHGVHGMNKDTLKLASDLNRDPNNPRLTIESNPDSVIALNNIDCVSQIPFGKMVKSKIPFVVGSDSGGIYGTNAEQLGLAAYYAGMDEDGFAVLEKHQQHLVNQQRAYSRKLAAKIPSWKTRDGKLALVKKSEGELAPVPLAPPDPQNEVEPELIAQKLRQDEVKLVDDPKNAPELDSRIPITLVGANGDRWEKIDPMAQHDIAIAVDMLAHALDPKRAYFAQGRTKLTGLSYILNDVISKANADLATENKDPFYNFGMLVAPNFTEKESYKHLTHMQRVSDKLLDLSDQLVAHTIDNGGILIAGGGAAFTRDIILKADIAGIHGHNNRSMMFLFSNAEGASKEKSQVLHPNYGVDDGRTLIKKIYSMDQTLFRPGFDISKLEELYEQSRKRAENYNFHVPADPEGQQVQDSAEINPSKGKTK